MLNHGCVILFIAGMAALALTKPSSAQAQSAPIFLTCDGFNANLNGTIRHVIEINGTAAVLDGSSYSVTKSNESYVLIGPMPDKNFLTKDLLAAPSRFIINRLDGSYFVLSNIGGASQRDWSRPEDAGCAVARQKF